MNKNEKKNNHHDQADGVENSLIAAQIVPHVQVPVGSQVVEKPAEKVAAVATSLMTVAAVSLSVRGGRRCRQSLLMMMPQCPHRIVVAVAVVATAAVPLAVAVATTVKDHHCWSHRNSYWRRM
jgi:hypothetical protein